MNAALPLAGARAPRSSPSIVPASAPRPALVERMLHVDPGARSFRDRSVRELPAILRPGDALIVNDAATLPASLRGRTEAGDEVELRLSSRLDDREWLGVLFGAGDHRTPTEQRPAPPSVPIGARLVLGSLRATVVAIDPRSPRLIVVRFEREGAAFWTGLYASGRLVQYAHVPSPLPLWELQSSFAGRPWAVEMPSAARPLRWELLDALRRRGVLLASLTHAAGLSSTGDLALDRALPFPERFELPAATVSTIDAARAQGGRVVAVGTSVVRALEGCALRHDGVLVAETAITALRIGRGFRPRIVDGLFTGIHDDPGTSHHELLSAFAPSGLLARAHEHAARAGYVGHELGDSTLILGA